MQVRDLVRVPCESALTPEQLGRFRTFVEEVSQHDGARPFSEQTLVALSRAAETGNSSARLFYFLDEKHRILGALVVLAPTDDAPGLIEGAVLPGSRGGGVMSFLTSFLVPKVITPEELKNYTVWVHQALQDPDGEISAKAQHFTQKYGFTPVRELHKMAVTLDDAARERIRKVAEEVSLPGGVRLRSYEDTDALAWLTLNAAAFAHHPEQGRLTAADLAERVGSDWFDASGFFLAEAPNGLAGYHWTKVPAPTGELAEGEVYAVGVSPAWQGKGLGKVLTLAGMDYLTRYTGTDSRPLDQIVLYVDAENNAAMKLYSSLGFTDVSIDRQYTFDSSLDRKAI